MNEKPVAADSFTIFLDGVPVGCRRGQTLAAALILAGTKSWRVTRRGRAQRGIFCGIGVCFDCLVRVNGSEPVRACLTVAEPGDRVQTDGV